MVSFVIIVVLHVCVDVKHFLASDIVLPRWLVEVKVSLMRDCPVYTNIL